MIVNMPLRATGPSSVNVLEQMRQGYFDRDVQNRKANIVLANEAQRYWDEGVGANAQIARAEDLNRANAILQLRQQQERLAAARQETERRKLADELENKYNFARLRADEVNRELKLVDQMQRQAEQDAADKMEFENFGRSLADDYLRTKRFYDTTEQEYNDALAQMQELQARIEEGEQMKEKPVGLSSWKQQLTRLDNQVNKDIRRRLDKADTALERIRLDADRRDFKIDDESGLIVHVPTGSRFSFRAKAPSVEAPVGPTLDIPRIASGPSYTLPGMTTPGENYFGPATTPTPAGQPAEAQVPWWNRGVRGAAGARSSKKYATAEEVRADFKAGKISREEAKRILMAEF